MFPFAFSTNRTKSVRSLNTFDIWIWQIQSYVILIHIIMHCKGRDCGKFQLWQSWHHWWYEFDSFKPERSFMRKYIASDLQWIWYLIFVRGFLFKITFIVDSQQDIYWEILLRFLISAVLWFCICTERKEELFPPRSILTILTPNKTEFIWIW